VNGRMSKVIHSYASIYAHAGPGAARNMERFAKKEWARADPKGKRALRLALEHRIREHYKAQRQMTENKKS